MSNTKVLNLRPKGTIPKVYQDIFSKERSAAAYPNDAAPSAGEEPVPGKYVQDVQTYSASDNNIREEEEISQEKSVRDTVNTKAFQTAKKAAERMDAAREEMETGKNTAIIKAYINNQLKRDKEADQLSIFDPRDPFTGSKEQMRGCQANEKRTCA